MSEEAGSLGRRLLPPLFRRLESLAAARRGDEPALEEAVRVVGWLLGVLGAAAGADLLFARREREGLRWVARALELGLPHRLEPASRGLPRLGSGEDWRTSFLFACLLEAHVQASRGPLRWQVERWGRGARLGFEPRLTTERERELEALSRALGGPVWRDGRLELPEVDGERP